MDSISANERLTLVATGKRIDLIDVRSPVKYRAIEVTVARNGGK